MSHVPESRATVLIVDDTSDNLALMSGLLKDRYRVKIASNGRKALEVARSAEPPDLILLDVMMPDLDGYQVCEQLKRDAATRDIPIIFLTANEAREDEQRGLEMGAVDYITKPASPAIILARVNTHLQLKQSADFLRDKSAFLESEVERRTREIQQVQDVTILTMASLSETRDNETGNHIRRTQHYVRALAEQLRTHPRFCDTLTDESIEQMFKSAPLHDIGKVGIPDRILLKPGHLTADEFSLMKTHTTLGHATILHVERELGREMEFLAYAKEIALSHHEKWDGSGYPQGLSGDDIPVSARLMALADVYDALISRRVYKPALPHAEARELIVEGKSQHFDPDVVDAFLQEESRFLEISGRFADSAAERLAAGLH